MTAGDPVTRYPLIDGTILCLDPRDVAAVCLENGWALGDIELCNSVNVPVGMDAGHAFFVVKPTEEIDPNTWHTLGWKTENGTTTFYQYTMIRRYVCGGDVDGDAPTIIEFADKRHVLKMSYANHDYNIRRNFPYAASPVAAASYYSTSLNSGATWTWQEVLDDLWDYLPPDIASSAPTLAWSPTAPPENYNVHGSAWDAIGKLLEQCQSVLVWTPTTDLFTIVRIGEEQAGLADAIEAVDKLFTAAPETDIQRAFIPEKIVYVAKKQRLTNGASTSAAAGGSLLVDPYYSVEKTTSVTGAQAGTKTEWFIDQLALVADDDSISNSSALSTIIDELHTKILARLDLGLERQLLFIPGIPTTLPLGSQVHNHLYRDYGEQGLVTEVRFDPSMTKTSRPIPHEEIITYPRVFAGKADSAISDGGTGTVSIWRWNGSAMEDTTKDVTALAYGAAIGSDEYVIAWEDDGLGWLVAPWAGGGGRDYGIMRVRNVTNFWFSAGDCIRLGKSLLHPDNELADALASPLMEARLSSTFNGYTGDYLHGDGYRYGILTEDLAPGKVGNAVVSGVAVIRSDSSFDTVDHARPSTPQDMDYDVNGEATVLTKVPDSNYQIASVSQNFKEQSGLFCGFYKSAFTWSSGSSAWQATVGGATSRVLRQITTGWPQNQYNGPRCKFELADGYGALDDAGDRWKATKSGFYRVNIRYQVKVDDVTINLDDVSASVSNNPVNNIITGWKCESSAWLWRRTQGVYEYRSDLVGLEVKRFVSYLTTARSGGNVTDITQHYDVVTTPQIDPSEFQGPSAGGIAWINRTFTIRVFEDDEFWFAAEPDLDIYAYGTASIPNNAKYTLYAEVVMTEIEYPPLKMQSWGNPVDSSALIEDQKWNEANEAPSTSSSDLGKFSFTVRPRPIELYELLGDVTTTGTGGTQVLPTYRFYSFARALAQKKHNLESDTLKWMLTNDAPDSSWATKSQVTGEVSAGFGYTAGGSACAYVSATESYGRYVAKYGDTTFTASGGDIANFHYAVLYNDTASNDELIGWIALDTLYTIYDGGYFKIDADSTEGLVNIG